MIPRIKRIETRPHFVLYIEFDNGEKVEYDVLDDINTIDDFGPLKTQNGLFQNYQVDESRTCISWSERIDLPSDILLEYGKRM